MKLSLVLATYNEEETIGPCISSCRKIVDEIIIVDGSSTDKTVKIARQFGAKVTITDNPLMFHINKQKAIDMASGDWILQLDADERVSSELAKEIKKVMEMSNEEIEEHQNNLPEKELFIRHQQLTNPKFETLNSKQIPNSQNLNFKQAELNAFYIPRLNYFLGKYLRYGGVYPDGVIRLFRKGKARLPCKSVHELMEVDGRIGWLQEPLLHMDSPTFKRYLERNSRYIDQLVSELKVKDQKAMVKNEDQKLKVFIVQIWQAFDWLLIKPVFWFISTTFRHKGILDGWQGVAFSFFSALRFPRAYMRYALIKR